MESCEFWSAFCESQIESDVLRPFLPRLLPVLLKNMVRCVLCCAPLCLLWGLNTQRPPAIRGAVCCAGHDSPLLAARAFASHTAAHPPAPPFSHSWTPINSIPPARCGRSGTRRCRQPRPWSPRRWQGMRSRTGTTRSSPLCTGQGCLGLIGPQRSVHCAACTAEQEDEIKRFVHRWECGPGGPSAACRAQRAQQGSAGRGGLWQGGDTAAPGAPRMCRRGGGLSPGPWGWVHKWRWHICAGRACSRPHRPLPHA